jgi:DNA-binding response OmpR family regulator
LRAANPTAALVVVGLRRCEIAHALDAGADVALAGEPGSAALDAHVQALARRAHAELAIGALTVDRVLGIVAVDGVPVALAPRELALLRCLASAPGRLFTKAELLERCWAAGPPPPRSRTLERHIARLRGRLGHHGQLLVTVWGVGYRLDAPV